MKVIVVTGASDGIGAEMALPKLVASGVVEHMALAAVKDDARPR